jgi:hypothetical protein
LISENEDRDWLLLIARTQIWQALLSDRRRVRQSPEGLLLFLQTWYATLRYATFVFFSFSHPFPLHYRQHPTLRGGTALQWGDNSGTRHSLLPPTMLCLESSSLHPPAVSQWEGAEWSLAQRPLTPGPKLAQLKTKLPAKVLQLSRNQNPG